MHRIEKVVAACQDRETGDLLQAGCRAALTAGSIIRELYSKPHTIRKKGAIDLVTEADVAAETAIISSLQEDAPGIEILAEESAGERQEMVAGRAWIIDPLDGTTNFAHGFPYFGVSIALVDGERPILGVVHCPMQDELFAAAAGAGSWLNGDRVRVSETAFLLEALVGTGFPYDIHSHLDTILEDLRSILPKVRDIRRAGAAAVDLAYLACGRLDGFWEIGLKPWDTAAGWLLVTEAGGELSDFGGAPFSPFQPEILASNGILHGQLRELIG